MSKYGPGGVLFRTEQKRSDKSPDYFGTVEIDRELLQEIQDQLQANEMAKLRLAGWRQTGRNSGKDFIGLKVSKPQEDQGNKSRSDSRNDSRNDRPADLDDEIPF